MGIPIIRIALSAAIAALLVTGCASSRKFLGEGGPVSIRVEKAEEAYISWVTVKPDGEDMVVSGKVKRKPNTPRDLKGHIDIVLLADDSRLPMVVGVPYSPQALPWPRIGMRKRSPRLVRKVDSSDFEARIPTVSLEGKTVKVRYHRVEEIPPEERLEQSESGS